jgi:hypothetical protein
MRSTARVLLAVGTSLVLAALAVAPSVASQYSREAYDWSDSGSYECGDGNWIDWEASGMGTLSIRTGTGPDAGAFFAHDRYSWRSVDTRRSDGVALFTEGHANSLETKATRVDGSVFLFRSIEAGAPYKVTDRDGTVLVRDRGVIKRTILFDTLGDATPGGEFIEDVSVAFGGPHPGWSFDICGVLG